MTAMQKNKNKAEVESAKLGLLSTRWKEIVKTRRGSSKPESIRRRVKKIVRMV